MCEPGYRDIAVMTLLGLCLAGAATAADEPSAGPPAVWMCHRNLTALLQADPTAWAFVRERVNVIKVYIGWLNKADQETLRSFAELADQAGFEIAVEMGGCLEFAPLDDTTGEESARIEGRKIRRLLDAGGRVDYLIFDGPVRRLMHPKAAMRNRDVQGFTSLDAAVDEVIDAIRAHRETLPDVKVHILTNFPNWGYRGDVSYHARGPARQDWGDYRPVIETLVRKTREAEVPIQGLQVDNPYEYAIGRHRSVKLTDPTTVDWIARILDLEAYAESEGLEFTLIVNSEAGGQTSDAEFYRRTLAFLDLYRERGGSPSGYVVQSWYPYPKALVPEDEGTSMTALVREVIRRVEGDG